MISKRNLARLCGASLASLTLACGSAPDEAAPPATGAVQQELAVTISCQSPGTGFTGLLGPPAPGLLPFTPLTSLQAVENPVLPRDPRTGALQVRDDLLPYVADLQAAIQLGKALFWDVQAGSDGKVACATCHYQAGADVRARNQLHPGPNARWDVQGVNALLSPADFPFTNLAAGRDLDDVAGSQGVRSSTYKGLDKAGNELTSAVTDPVFGTARRPGTLNTPAAVNAVFNHRSFFNGRAQPEFNGVNPWGARDVNARVWAIVDSAGTLGKVQVRILDASLASQAVGPPLNTLEMSAAGRTFPELGKKLLLSKPLRNQTVHPSDGVLGPLAETSTKGLKTTYAALIQKAFQPRWWNSTKSVSVDKKSYSLMQANFSLFWGLAIMLYEATLVSDDSPMDRYVASRVFDVATATLVRDDPALLEPVVARLASMGVEVGVADVLAGLDLFEKPLPPPGTAGLPPGTGVGCSLCHLGAETTSATVRNLTGFELEADGAGFAALGFDPRMERMFMGVRTPAPVPPQELPPVPLGSDVLTFDPATYAVTVTGIAGVPVTPRPVRVATYDAGWYNVGVRPTAEDLGVGGLDAFGRPLSWTEYFQATLPDPSIIRVPGGGLGCVDAAGNPVTPPAAPLGSPFAGEVLNPATGLPLLAGPLRKTEATDVAGSFKTPSLRNVELTGPYFHNGGKATLREVVELYDAGGDFQNATLSPLIRPLGLSEAQERALLAFLVALTDERVLYERAPFDHPELPIPEGQTAAGVDLVVRLPAVGAAGAAAPLRPFLGLGPFQ